MGILRLKNITKIDLKSEDSIEVFKYKYIKTLNSLNFRTGSESYGITFKRKIKTITTSGENRTGAMKVFREGVIYISRENNKMTVNWSVNLDTLYFLSCLISVIISLLTVFLIKFSLFNTLIIGLIGFIFSSIIGIWTINAKILEINNSCLEFDD